MLDTTSLETSPGAQPTRLFLSYCTADHDQAARLRGALECAGGEVWMAPDSIRGPLTWAEQIVGAVESSTAVVVLLSPASMASSHVAREISLAVDARTPVVPVRISPAPLTGALQYLLQLSQWLDAFESPVDEYAAAILERATRPAERVRIDVPPLAAPATTRASVEIAPATLASADASYAVTQQGLRIGRTEDNDVVIVDPNVSRHHCSISATEDGFVLTDLHSTNGTRVNDRATMQCLLSSGDRLRVGDAELTFTWPAEG